MNEIYVDTSEDIHLTLFDKGNRVNATTPPTVTITETHSGDVIENGVAATVETDVDGNETYVYNFSLDLTNDPTRYKVQWDYTYTDANGNTQDGNRVQYVEVVVPYVWPEELKSEFPGSLGDKSREELKSMERTVRQIINNYCSQDFQYELNRTKTAYGRSSETLALPDRLFNLISLGLEGTDLTNYVEIVPDSKYELKRLQGYDDAIKRDIQNVLTNKRYFKENREYEITGDWGWEYVPNEVHNAALILVNDYFCNDAKWREKHVDNVRAADWRMEFTKTGDQTTGNANADMMLQRFRTIDAVII